jgi:hypothetical protein
MSKWRRTGFWRLARRKRQDSNLLLEEEAQGGVRQVHPRIARAQRSQVASLGVAKMRLNK